MTLRVSVLLPCYSIIPDFSVISGKDKQRFYTVVPVILNSWSHSKQKKAHTAVF